MSERIPAEVLHPGEFVAEELAARGLSVTDLGVPGGPGGTVEAMCALVAGTGRVTPPVAAALEAVLGMDARYWLNLQAAYDRFGGVSEGGNSRVDGAR